MSHGRKPVRPLLLGLLAIGTAALAQNFVTSRPFLSDAVFVFGVGVALLVGAFPAGGLVHEGVRTNLGNVPVPKRLDLGLRSRSIYYLLFAIALSLFAVTTLKANLMPLYGWLAFLGSLLLLILGARLWDRSRGLSAEVDETPRWELAALVIITLIAALMRFSSLTSLPFGVWYDEAMNGLDALSIANGEAFPVYLTTNQGRPAFMFYVIALFFKAFGSDLLALRLVPAVVGVLTVPVFYKTIRQFFGPHPALVGALLLAVSRWHVNFSRIVFEAVFVPLLACGAVYFLARGFRTKRATDFALGGLIFGLGLNTYMAFRLFPVVIILFLAHKFVFERRSYRSVLPGLVAFGLAVILLAAPLLRYAYDNPGVVTSRIDTTSVFAGKTPEQGRVALNANIEKHLLMFNVRGDQNGRHNIPGEPMLDPFTAALFVLGAGYSLWNWRRSAHFIFVATFVVMLSAGILSLDFEAPQALRSIGVIPAVYAFAALPLGLLWQAIGWSVERRRLPAAVDSSVLEKRPMWVTAGPLMILVALTWIGYTNYSNYFNRQAASFASFSSFSTGETYVAYSLRELVSQDFDVYVSPLYAGSLPTIRFLAPNAPEARVIDSSTGIPLRSEKKGVVVFIEPQYSGLYQQLKSLYPGGTFTEFANKPLDSTPAIYDVRIPREELRRGQGLTATTYPADRSSGQSSVARKVERLEFDWGSGTQVAAPFTEEWRGTLFVPQYGKYEFAVEGNADTALYLDETTVLDTETARVANVTLAKGNHAIRLVAIISQGNENLRVMWKMPGGQTSVVGGDFLYLPPVTNNGLLGKYYRSANWQGEPALAQIDPSIAFYFHLIPLPRPYSVEWTGKVYAPVAGRYAFGTENVSASQLFINGKLLVDNSAQGQYREAQVSLEAGFHDITLRYHDKDSFSRVYLYWTMPGRVRQLIPAENLFPPQGSYEVSAVQVAPATAAPPSPAALATPVPPKPVATPTVAAAPTIQSKRSQSSLEIGKRGRGDGEFEEPRDLAIDKEGNIYVADTGNARVQKFAPDGKFLTKWGKRGEGDGEFQEPLAIVVDSQNQVLVLDSTSGWIQRFDASGKFLGKLAGPQAQLFHPRGLSIDAKDNVYVADTGGCRIVIFKSTGEYVGVFGSKGSGDGQMVEPVDAEVIADGTILVSDAGNKRIQKFDSERRYVAQWRVADAVAFNGAHLATAPDGSVYATEPERGRVVRYGVDMKPLGAIGEAGEGPGQFRQPVGLFVDREGNLFVADTYNHRVQKFAPGQ